MAQPKTMKVFYTAVLVLASVLYTNISKAQTATDIIINPQVGERQLSVAIDAGNGSDYFAVYNYIDSNTSTGGYRLMKSTDRGFTWTPMVSYSAGAGRIQSIDIVARFDNAGYYKVYVAYVERTASANYTVKVQQYDVLTGTADFVPFVKNHGSNRVYDVAIAEDIPALKAVNSFPYGIGLLYSAAGTSSDSLFFCTNGSSGTGHVAMFRYLVTTTTSYLRSVDIDYGVSPNQQGGQYHFIWERLDDPNDAFGHIFYSRNNSSVTSGSFGTPFCLDSLNAFTINQCRNPRIAALHDTFNIENTFPAVVVNEVNMGSFTNIISYANRNAATGQLWQRRDLGISTTDRLSPDIVYTDSAFAMVYYDPTNAIIEPYRLRVNGEIDSTIENTNNEPGFISPAPKVMYDGSSVGYAWIRQTSSAAGKALFDAHHRLVTTNNIGESICQGSTFPFGNSNLSTAGSYVQLIQTINGDSITELNLTVNDLPATPSITANGNVLSTGTYSSYQWQLNGGDIVGATGATHTALISGNYTVRGTDANGCSATSQVFAHTISGIDNVLLQSLRVYPNPASNMLYIDGDYKAASVTITDIVGQQMLQSNVSTHAALNVEYLAAGMYIVTFSVEGKTASLKFNKQ